MRALRSHVGSCAWLALFALIVQLVASFGCRCELRAGGYGEGLSASQSGASSETDIAPDPDDFCPICAAMALPGVLVNPEPPATVALAAQHVTWVTCRIAILMPHGGRQPFQARAPPA